MKINVLEKFCISVLLFGTIVISTVFYGLMIRGGHYILIPVILIHLFSIAYIESKAISYIKRLKTC